jgi:hypothetical protein
MRYLRADSTAADDAPLPLLQSVGVVDRIDERRGDHCVIVVFRGIACPPFGAPWVDTFTPDELVSVEPPR